MLSPARTAQRVAWAVPALTLAVAIGVLAGYPVALQAHAALQRDTVASGQLWQLWTGHLVHWSAAHAVADALGVISAGLLAGALYGPARLALGLLMAPPLLSLGVLALQPELTSYRGASGLVVGLGSLAWTGLWRTGAVRRRWLGLVALALALKLVLAWQTEAQGLSVPGIGLPADVTVAWSAHALGALLGLIAGVLMRPAHGLRTASGPRTAAPRR